MPNKNAIGRKSGIILAWCLTIGLLLLTGCGGSSNTPANKGVNTNSLAPSPPQATTRTTTANVMGSTSASPALTAVRFAKAGISFIPGTEWKQLIDGPFATGKSLCLPVLEGIRTNNGSLIKVSCIETALGAKAVADILKQQFDADSKTKRESFKLRSFTTVSQLEVVQASYDYKANRLLFQRKLCAAVYFVQNKDNKCIAIQHVAFSENTFDGFESMALS